MGRIRGSGPRPDYMKVVRVPEDVVSTVILDAPVPELTKADVKELAEMVEMVADMGPDYDNQILEINSQISRLGDKLFYIQDNVPSKEEMRAVFKALESKDAAVSDRVKLLENAQPVVLTQPPEIIREIKEVKEVHTVEFKLPGFVKVALIIQTIAIFALLLFK